MKTSYISKLVTNIHHTAIYTLASTARLREQGLDCPRDGQILILFPSHGCEGLIPGSSTVTYFEKPP